MAVAASPGSEWRGASRLVVAVMARPVSALPVMAWPFRRVTVGAVRPGAIGRVRAVAARSGPARRGAVRPSRHGLSRRDEAGLGRPGEVGQGLPRQGQAVPARPAMVWLGWAGRGLFRLVALR